MPRAASPAESSLVSGIPLDSGRPCCWSSGAGVGLEVRSLHPRFGVAAPSCVTISRSLSSPGLPAFLSPVEHPAKISRSQMWLCMGHHHK